jgi:hypothetical protein
MPIQRRVVPCEEKADHPEGGEDDEQLQRQKPCLTS